MTIKVCYKDNTYDIVSAMTLQRLIDSDKIRMFYRYSEKRWIAVGEDTIRTKSGPGAYKGPERRSSDIQLRTA